MRGYKPNAHNIMVISFIPKTQVFSTETNETEEGGRGFRRYG
jgi:hypothetical protein